MKIDHRLHARRMSNHSTVAIRVQRWGLVPVVQLTILDLGRGCCRGRGFVGREEVESSGMRKIVLIGILVEEKP